MKNQRPSLRDYQGARLVEKRLAAGLTREQLAAKARVSTLTLKNWERGRTKPQPDKVRAVREVLAEAAPTPAVDRHALRADVEKCLENVHHLEGALKSILTLRRARMECLETVQQLEGTLKEMLESERHA